MDLEVARCWRQLSICNGGMNPFNISVSLEKDLLFYFSYAESSDLELIFMKLNIEQENSAIGNSLFSNPKKIYNMSEC